MVLWVVVGEGRGWSHTGREGVGRQSRAHTVWRLPDVSYIKEG